MKIYLWVLLVLNALIILSGLLTAIAAIKERSNSRKAKSLFLAILLVISLLIANSIYLILHL